MVLLVMLLLLLLLPSTVGWFPTGQWPEDQLACTAAWYAAAATRSCCRVFPHRPPRHQSYHRGGAGQHVLSATRLQLGNPGPDGSSIITELDMHSSCSVSMAHGPAAACQSLRL
jgi:hypothetical protein